MWFFARGLRENNPDSESAPDFRIRDRNLTVMTAGVLSRMIGAPYGTLYENLVGEDSRFPVRLRRWINKYVTVEVVELLE